MHSPNGFHALPPPSASDTILLTEIRRDLWAMQAQIGWTQHRLATLETRMQAQEMAIRYPGQPQLPPPGSLASATELVKALGSVLPELRQFVIATGGLVALALSLLLVPDHRLNGSAPTPPATVLPSAP